MENLVIMIESWHFNESVINTPPALGLAYSILPLYEFLFLTTYLRWNIVRSLLPSSLEYSQAIIQDELHKWRRTHASAPAPLKGAQTETSTFLAYMTKTHRDICEEQTHPNSASNFDSVWELSVLKFCLSGSCKSVIMSYIVTLEFWAVIPGVPL